MLCYNCILLRLSLIFVLGYLSTSFQIVNERSIRFGTQQDSSTQNVAPHQYSVHTLKLNAEQVYHIDLGQQYTAIKITTLDNSAPQITLNSTSDSLQFGVVQLDENIDIPPSFAVFTKQSRLVELSSDLNSKVRIELFYAPAIKIPSSLKSKKTDCEKPSTIAQSTWRKGLPPPKEGRNATIVKHCVIHHSAGNNNDTDYLNIIRNIYLLHTESNGWDDIGYNFVIAPNGAIYSGRDAQNVADEDNIQGAHFCGKNGGTMGICLLGNYNTIKPTIPMTNSLTDLLSWKLHKENLSTLEAFPHPDALSPNLPTVTMHRSGCATECPGENVASFLDSIRLITQNKLNDCNGVTTAKKPILEFKQRIYPNPSDGRFYIMVEKGARISSYKIFSLEGKELINNTLAKNGRVNVDLNKGWYILSLLREGQIISNTRIKIIEP